MARFRYRLSTLLLVIAGICVVSAGLYYARLFVTGLIAAIQVESLPPSPTYWEREVTILMLAEMKKDPEFERLAPERLEFLEEKLRSGTEQEREVSAWVLGENCQSGTLREDRLIETLSDPSLKVRRAAVSALGSMKSNRARPRIVELLKSSDKNVATEAQKALEAIDAGSNPKQAKPPLSK